MPVTPSAKSVLEIAQKKIGDKIMSETKIEDPKKYDGVHRCICGFCSTGSCLLLETVENGKITKIEPDWDSPMNPGPYCVKWKYGVEYIYHKDRPMYPLKRIGKRGEGKWQRISWEQATDEIGAKVKEIIAKYGGESICCMNGTGRAANLGQGMSMFSLAVGSPNFGSAASQH